MIGQTLSHYRVTAARGAGGMAEGYRLRGFLPGGGSTDVGDVSWLVPEIRLRATTAPKDTPWHSWAVVACGGFAAAELELNINRSTISRHIKDLETRLGVTLCRRGRGGFALTREGEQVYTSALKMMARKPSPIIRKRLKLQGSPLVMPRSSTSVRVPECL